jgi:DHA1 family bicyclomycin/chloramphenicol resistance-like MFS transporter
MEAQRKMDLISTERKVSPSFVEFVIILSLIMSLTALSTDAMLPALPQIGNELGTSNPNDRQLVISVIFLGSALGGLFFGPLSDKTGRKPAIYTGYSLYITGSLISIFSINFPMMLLGRIFQGLGLSSPQAVMIAIVRDQFEGRKMARVMSFSATVFVLVPMVAPSIGQGIILLAGWRSIFSVFLFFALITVFWFALRIPETLAQENRAPFSLKRIIDSIQVIFKIRPVLGYALTAGLISGFFLGYLNSSQQIFQEQYALGDLFPLYFAIISISLGMASLLNARLVMRLGMIKLVRWALRTIFGLAAIFLWISIVFGGQPPLWGLMVYLMMSFFCTGILWGNLNALAMQPLGHMAGVGSAVTRSFSSLISLVLGTLIGRSYNGTILPLVIGITILTGIALFVIRWAKSE